jgi:hypothetical protein
MLIYVWGLSTMITNNNQSFGITCDSDWRIGWRSLTQHFPITMNAMGIPFCHLSNTIIMFRGYYKNHGARLIGWMLENIKIRNFTKWKTMPYLALIGAKCCVKLPCPYFVIISYYYIIWIPKVKGVSYWVDIFRSKGACST